jgi:hypothetical protein
MMAEVEGFVVQVLAEVIVTMTSCGDVKIALDFVAFYVAIDPTAVRYSTPRYSRRLLKLLVPM